MAGAAPGGARLAARGGRPALRGSGRRAPQGPLGRPRRLRGRHPGPEPRVGGAVLRASRAPRADRERPGAGAALPRAPAPSPPHVHLVRLVLRRDLGDRDGAGAPIRGARAPARPGPRRRRRARGGAHPAAGGGPLEPSGVRGRRRRVATARDAGRDRPPAGRGPLRYRGPDRRLRGPGGDRRVPDRAAGVGERHRGRDLPRDRPRPRDGAGDGRERGDRRGGRHAETGEIQCRVRTGEDGRGSHPRGPRSSEARRGTGGPPSEALEAHFGGRSYGTEALFLEERRRLLARLAERRLRDLADGPRRRLLAELAATEGAVPSTVPAVLPPSWRGRPSRSWPRWRPTVPSAPGWLGSGRSWPTLDRWGSRSSSARKRSRRRSTPRSAGPCRAPGKRDGSGRGRRPRPARARSGAGGEAGSLDRPERGGPPVARRDFPRSRRTGAPHGGPGVRADRLHGSAGTGARG